MKIQTFGSKYHPVVLMLPEHDAQLETDSKLQDLSQEYHVVIPIFHTDHHSVNGDELVDTIKNQYGTHIFALCSVAKRWELAQYLLSNTNLQADEIIVEGEEIPPKQFIYAELEARREELLLSQQR